MRTTKKVHRNLPRLTTFTTDAPSESSILKAGQCTHERLWRAGIKNGKQTLVCAYCRRYFTENTTRLFLIDAIAQVKQHYLAGLTKKEIVEQFGLPASRIKAVFKLLYKHIPRKVPQRKRPNMAMWWKQYPLAKEHLQKLHEGSAKWWASLSPEDKAKHAVDSVKRKKK